MRHRRSDKLRFIGQWLRNPRQTAAVAPSSPELASAMLGELPANARRVVELGGGTGAITRALVDGGISGEALLVLELNEELHAHLRRRFPDEVLVLGDAVELPRLASEAGFLDAGPADAVISGLGLLAMDRELVTNILRSAFACLRPDGRFIQFTYGPVSPVHESVLDALGLRMRRGAFVLRNVPPATVYVYERATDN
ncbi:methyltransferase domain-containing protein [Thermomonas sp. HDW16]|uniref:class I SAM-dependent methyltransferase n=1 Tax=Thermomonas sp. HDW16 TaxID=2714945 RepID=UPI001407FE3C|nr:methyltransferase domain-containing protein [Thermomonas sp. HDW16]QIL20098.1 methyltransferase domain-containing protein [Thermomonas sp. HDW16]